MVSFELGEELRNMFFRLVTSGESNLRPSDLRSDARKSEGLKFYSSWGLRIFIYTTLVTRRKNIFLNIYLPL